ncbi:hypothetical protein FA95DRAFT_1520723 [Auriscalpium vulgare]|uniref:Uncharacterized protein n=1 Tax=Auriscalpium vulgare TaxID=40419 RepID=A0ACB8RPM7_9AGAM|nr:hypothetical protein FA95DRAFT_1520723 [Auriscalpium vulgare]
MRQPSRNQDDGGESSSTPDRYAALQRKLDLLGKVHADAKKSYQGDLERLKGELQRTQKINNEQSDRIDKLKRQNDALDVRIQDLKQASLTDQAELKDMRVKLRMAEQEKAQLSSKQVAAGDAKKALHNLEARRREELRERERQTADLSKAVASEKKRREAAEAMLQEAAGKAEKEVRESRASAQRFETQVKEAKAQAERAQTALRNSREETSNKEEDLLEQLDALRMLLTRVAKQYGALAAATVPKAKYDHLEREHNSSQFRVFRLQRKLANSEDQVAQLAGLIRHTQDANDLLKAEAREAEREHAFYASALRQSALPSRDAGASTDVGLAEDLASAHADTLSFDRDMQEMRAATAENSFRYYRGFGREVMYAFRVAVEDWEKDSAQAHAHVAERDSARSARDAALGDVQALRTELLEAQRQAVELTGSVEIGKAREAALAQKIEAAETMARQDAATHLRALQKEKEITQKHATTVRMHKMAEEALRAEIEQLTTELTDAERYQEAYYSLADEVGTLAARNVLAEGEAVKLSNFVAEILSHNNPAQRIMYLDRIRRELAETKQDLLLTARERDAAHARENALQNELAMYIAVPGDLKAKTNITRVTRIPLATQSLNVKAGGEYFRAEAEEASIDPRHFADVSGEMTMDELM